MTALNTFAGRRCMKTRMIVATALLVTLGVTPHLAAAQPLTAAMCTASRFVPVPSESLELIRALEAVGTYVFTAKREQPNYPWGPVSDISLECGWTVNPVAGIYVQMLRDAPEEQPDTVMRGMAWTEPAGKMSHRDGVLVFTRNTAVHVGIGSEPDLITYNGHWVGAVSGGLMSIGVSNVFGSKDTVQSIIVEVIDRVTGSSR
jgi:hypothetical protein